jgi:hypothetical protein
MSKQKQKGLSTRKKPPMKISSESELNSVLQDIAPLYVARKVATKNTKTANELKGNRTKMTFTTLVKLLRDYMTTSHAQDLPLPDGHGSVTLEEKKTMPSAEDALISFYPKFQKQYCQRDVTELETMTFVQELREQREENRKVTMALTYVPPE